MSFLNYERRAMHPKKAKPTSQIANIDYQVNFKNKRESQNAIEQKIYAKINEFIMANKKVGG